MNFYISTSITSSSMGYPSKNQPLLGKNHMFSTYRMANDLTFSGTGGIINVFSVIATRQKACDSK